MFAPARKFVEWRTAGARHSCRFNAASSIPQKSLVLDRAGRVCHFRLVMKIFIFASCLVFAYGALMAQTNGWQPSPGHTQMAIWPGAAPDAVPVAGSETATTSTDLVAGKPVVIANNVSQPTMTVYSPKGKNTGVAVVVFPGGATRFWPWIWKARRSAIG